MRGFMYDFIQKLAPHLTKQVVDEAYYRHTHRLEMEELFSDVRLPSY